MTPRRLIPLALALALSGCGDDDGDDNKLSAAQLTVDTFSIELGAFEGELLNGNFVIHNEGDLALGIGDIFLASAADPDRGHAGNFQVIWSAGDVLDASGTPVGANDDKPARIPSGGSLEVAVTYDPSQAGEHYDAVIVRSIDADNPEGSVLEGTWMDPDNTVAMVYLHGNLETDPISAPYVPPRVEMGRVFEPEEANLYVRNYGPKPYRITSAALRDGACADGFSLSTSPTLPVEVTQTTTADFGVTYDPQSLAAASCVLDIKTDDPTWPSFEVSVRANNDSLCPDTPPVLTIHSPTTGQLLAEGQPFEITMSIRDDQPANTLYCSIIGRPLYLGTLASCITDGNGEYFVIDVPWERYEYKSGPEVLRAHVTDMCGTDVATSVPVLIKAAPSENDMDGDGFTPADGDCDDNNDTVYPYAAEIADRLDNDCDTVIDEQTIYYDDDRDGFSEEEGDCNDGDPFTGPDSNEIADLRDNDCDGDIDENTSNSDDDGDGASEALGDCNDSDSSVGPHRLEICEDKIDNNCNTLLDDEEPCVDVTTDPMIVGGISVGANAVDAGASIALYVAAVGDIETIEWLTNDGVLSSATSAATEWTAPESVPAGSYDTVTITVTITDVHGGQAWTSVEIDVYEPGYLDESVLNIEADTTAQASGCSALGAAPLWAWAGLPLLLWARRRKAWRL